MIKRLVSTVAGEFSGARARNHVASIIQFHRIQASPGFRQAAEYVARVLTAAGVRNEIRRFPADGKKCYWSYRSFPAWEVSGATLDLIEPEKRRLADFAECPTSLIQRSAPTRPVEAELVVLEDGEERNEYRNLNLCGKIVLSKGNVARVFQLAVGEHKALGVVSDLLRDAQPVRGRYDLPDARQYLGVFGDTDDLKTFGFVISVKEGERLRALVRNEARKGRKVMVRAEVKTRLYAGQFDVVDALIPGKTREEILLVAHLCHAQPSANDNASGSACLLEVARIIQKLVASGRCAPLLRSIRCLWVPEFSGTYAYLATYPEVMERTIAGLNLDMVGESQELCGSSLLIESPPWSAPSYAVELLRRIRDELLSEAQSHSGQGSFPLFRYADVPYSGGSDHAVLNDPTVGISCPMIIQWPDRFYHTSEDTLDKVDSKSLFRAGVLAGAYALFLAQAGKQQAKWLAEEVVGQAQIELVRNCRSKLTELAEAEGVDIVDICRFENRTKVWLEQKLHALDAVNRLAKITDEVRALKQELRDIFAREMRKFAVACPYDRGDPNLSGTRSRWEREAAKLIPRRLYPGPIQLRSLISRSDKDWQEWYHQFIKRHPKVTGVYGDIALFWCDGHRTVLDIADLMEAETGSRDVEGLVAYFRFLKRLKLVALKRS